MTSGFPGATARPNNRGDQAIFNYDVRDGFTTFVDIRNDAQSELHVLLVFYGPDFATPSTRWNATGGRNTGEPISSGPRRREWHRDARHLQRKCSPHPVWTGMLSAPTLARDAGAATG